MQINPSNAVFNPLGWQVFGASVRGASHQTKGLPNQDAIYWETKSGTGSQNLVILAIADGHGSDKYFRSAIGAHLATKVAVEITNDFVNNIDPEALNNGVLVSRIAKELLPRKIAQLWLTKVQEDLSKNPISDSELEKFSEKQRTEIVKSPFITYGATLLATVIAKEFILYLQIGDGNILTVTESGDVSNALPDDPRAFADTTPSLCSENSWTNFRITYRPTLDDLPALVLLTTDGYKNSFNTPEGFEKIGSDILEMLRSDGLSCVQEQLEDWLNETTNKGSGDDITLGAIFRFASSSEFAEPPDILEKKELKTDAPAVSIISNTLSKADSISTPPVSANTQSLSAVTGITTGENFADVTSDSQELIMDVVPITDEPQELIMDAVPVTEERIADVNNDVQESSSIQESTNTDNIPSSKTTTLKPHTEETVEPPSDSENIGTIERVKRYFSRDPNR